MMAWFLQDLGIWSQDKEVHAQGWDIDSSPQRTETPKTTQKEQDAFSCLLDPQAPIGDHLQVTVNSHYVNI